MIEGVLGVIVVYMVRLHAIRVNKQVMWSFETARIPKRSVMMPSEIYSMAKPVMTNRVVLACVAKPMIFPNIGMRLMVVKLILSVTFVNG